jgi:hypothetical protein
MTGSRAVKQRGLIKDAELKENIGCKDSRRGREFKRVEGKECRRNLNKRCNARQNSNSGSAIALRLITREVN